MAKIYLIRHAEADYDWNGPDGNRPLSARGVRQARWMADYLKSQPIDELRCAPHRRCRQTAEEIGNACGLEPIQDEGLHIARSFRVAKPTGTAVWVSHSNNIPGAVAALGVPCHTCGHASAWVLEFDDSGQVVRYEYIEPEV